MDLLLEAALNGGRSPADHPAMPVYPTQLSAATAEAALAGASCRALSRSGNGWAGRSPAAADVARAVAEVSTQGVPFGISTGAWIISDPVRRLIVVAEWTLLPDFVAINFDEEGAVELPPSSCDGT